MSTGLKSSFIMFRKKKTPVLFHSIFQLKYLSTSNFGSRKSDVFSPHDNFTENQKHIPSFLLFHIDLFHRINYIFHVTNYLWKEKLFNYDLEEKVLWVSSFNVRTTTYDKQINRLAGSWKKCNLIYFSYGKQLRWEAHGLLLRCPDFMLAVRPNKEK